jgi:hypothetical protein
VREMMKNIDVIKSMSIEEMAELFEEVVTNVVKELEKSSGIEFKPKFNYLWHLKQWLAQEAIDDMENN